MVLMTLVANAKVDVDFSSRFTEGTNVIDATSAWGWHSVDLRSYDVMDYEYLYIRYESTCSFNLILQNPDWQNAYQVSCNANETEAYIKLTPHAYTGYSCVVIQNHAEGQITVEKIYFCTEDEFFNPAPEDHDEAVENLVDIYLRYQQYEDGLPLGDDYGYYSEELYNEFVKALDVVNKLGDKAMQEMTTEALNAAAQAIVDAYRTLMASKKQYLPENGYYRFVCARQFYTEDEETGETAFFQKALYSGNDGTNQWKTLDAADPTFLWTLQRQEDGTYLMANPANHLYFSSPEKCSEAQKFIAFDPVLRTNGAYEFSWPMSTEEDVVVFNFRFSDQPANNQMYIHCNWHDGGKGWGGPMTTWFNTNTDSGASEWFIQPVSDEEAQAILNDNSFAHDFVVMLADAKEKAILADDMIKTKLITEASQFSSPYSQNDLGSRDGGDLSSGVLIDGDLGSFWHSHWEGGNVEAGVHYLQVELPEAVGGSLEFDIARRQNIASDHVTKWSVYGSDSPDGGKDSYEWIADLETPYTDYSEQPSVMFTIEDGKEFEYLRFYAEATTSGRGYFHVSELQLFALSANPTNQAATMGKVFTDLQAAIAAADLVDQNAVSRADYEALKAAYDPFVALFVDPTPLREAIAGAENIVRVAEVGNNPGQWSQQAIDGWNQLMADARAYDQAGKYTSAQSEDYISKLAAANFSAAANQLNPNKYYAIRFASEEKYEEQGWSTGNVAESDFGPLFDTYLAPAGESDLVPTPAGDVRQGSFMFFTDDRNADIAFRFVPAGDNRYIIQHKASGLFVQVYGYDSWTGLTLNPTVFTIEAVGNGECTLHGADYAGNDLSYLHAQLRDHRLVTWHDHNVGSNSGLIIEEVADVEGEPAQPLADFRTGELTTMCYPVAVAPSAGSLYTVAGTYDKDGKVFVALNKVQKAAAGQPVVYIAEGTYDAENVEARTTVTLNVGTDIAAQPLNDGALKGAYADTDLTEAAFIVNENAFQPTTEEKAKVWANHAYIVPGAGAADADATYDLVLEVGGDLTGVQQTLSNVARSGNVYNAAGQLVRRGATLNEVQQLPSGLYILNGVKVLVK